MARFTNQAQLRYGNEITNSNFDTYNSLTPNWYYKVLR